MIIQIIFALISFIIAYLVFSHAIQIWHVFVAAILTGTLFAFDMPTRNALMVDMVDKENLPSALSLSSGIFNAARALGPAAAGIMIAAIGIAPAYLIDGISFVAVIISLLLIKIPPPVPHHENHTIREGFTEGIRYIKTHKIIAFLLILVAIITLATWPATVLLPVFAHDIYKRGEVGFGLLQSFYGIGAMVGAFGFSFMFSKITNVYKVLIIVCVSILGMYVMFALTPSYIMALILYMFAGWGMATFYSMANVLLQLEIPNKLRGRMMSYYSFVIFGTMPISSLVTSLLVNHIGARLTVLLWTLLSTLLLFSVFMLAQHISSNGIKTKMNALILH